MRRSEALVALVGAALLASADRSAAQSTRPRTAIVVSPITVIGMVNLYYAVNTGMFERAGLDVTVVPAASGAAGLTSVVGGAAQISFANVLTLSIAHAKGIPVRLLAPGGQHTAAPAGQWDVDGTGLVAPDSPVRTPKDLEGRVVAVASLGDLFAVAVHAWLENAGADVNKVKFVELPPAAMLAALLDKRVDASTLGMPFQTAAKAAGARSIGNQFDAIGRSSLTGAWFANASWVEQHHDAAVQFATVMRNAAEYTNTHPDQMIATMAGFTKLPEDTVRTMPRQQIPLGLQTSGIQPIIDAAAKYHVIPAPFNARDFMVAGVP
jgi:NitT/TauT family transport system substrate-binding protein